MSICGACADKAQEIQNIQGNCPSSGGIIPTVYYADISDQAPQDVVFNEDGSVFSFDLGCVTLKKVDMRKDIANIITTKNTSENGLVYSQQVNLFANDLGNQAVKDAIRTMENLDKVMVIYTDNNGATEIAGFTNGLTGNPGQRLTGSNRTEPNRNEIVLVGEENAEPITLDRGDAESTKEYLESLTKPKAVFDPMQVFSNNGTPIAGTIEFVQFFGAVGYAVVGQDIYKSLDKGNTWALEFTMNENPRNSANGRKLITMPNVDTLLYVDDAVQNINKVDLVGLTEATTYTNPSYDITAIESDGGKVVAGAIQPPTMTDAHLIISTDSGDTFAVAPNAFDMTTTDPGVTLAETQTIWLLSSGEIIFICGDATFFRTVSTRDNGTTYTGKASIPASFAILASKISDKLLFFTAVDNNTVLESIYRSTDGLESVTKVYTGDLQNPFGQIVNTDFGLFTSNQNLHQSQDCGETWTAIETDAVAHSGFGSLFFRPDVVQSEGDSLFLNQTPGATALLDKYYLPCTKSTC